MREWLTLTAVVGLLVLTAATPAGAQPVGVPDTWGGDFWSRPRLTGSWGGFRDELGKKGVVFDVDLTLTPRRSSRAAATPAPSSGATPTTR